jgi:hypothetical protein
MAVLDEAHRQHPRDRDVLMARDRPVDPIGDDHDVGQREDPIIGIIIIGALFGQSWIAKERQLRKNGFR